MLASVMVMFVATGCATTVTVRGYPEADVYVETPPASASFVFVGTTSGSGVYELVYALPELLLNAKVGVRVSTGARTFNFLVFTDRNTLVRYPPEGYLSVQADPGVKILKEREAEQKREKVPDPDPHQLEPRRSIDVR